MVARAEPDGYTLMAESVSNAINPTLYKKLPYDQLKDLIPVASIDVVPNVMDINLDVPAKTVPEFIAYAKPIPARSAWARAASARRRMWRASCSR
jgi:tripartite-type tricarboxylate transporter receptor subunit TctC